MKVEWVVIVFGLQATFFAAVFWATTRMALAQLRKDHERDKAEALQQRNNIGDKVQQVYLKLFYVAWMLSPEDKKQEILNALVRRLT